MKEQILQKLQRDEGQLAMSDLKVLCDVTLKTLPDFEEALFELEQDERITIVENHSSAAITAFENREPEDMVYLRE